MNNPIIPNDATEIKQSNISILMDLLRADGCTTTNKKLKHAIGNNEAELFSELVSRMFYFEDHNQLDSEGYFFNTVLDLQHGTALTDYQQRRAISKLEELQLISTRLKGSPPKRYFKITGDMQVIANYLLQGKEIMKELKIKIEQQKLSVSKSKKTKDFKSEETKDLNLKKLKTNNTDLNITNIKDLKEGNTPPQKPSSNSNEEPPQDELTGTDEVFKAGIAYYREHYELRTDKQPIISGADVKNLKSVVRGLTAEDLTGCLALMFADEWYKDKGWPLKTFASQINQFIAKSAAEKKEPGLSEYPPNVRKALELIEKYDTENNDVHLYDENEIIKRGQALSVVERRQAKLQELEEEAEFREIAMTYLQGRYNTTNTPADRQEKIEAMAAQIEAEAETPEQRRLYEIGRRLSNLLSLEEIRYKLSKEGCKESEAKLQGYYKERGELEKEKEQIENTIELSELVAV